MNELFVMYEYFLLAANPKKSLYDELERQFENEDPLDLIADFKAFTTGYQQHIYDSNSPLDYSFFYLRWSIYWKTILSTAVHIGYPDIKEFKTTLRRFSIYFG